MDLQLPTAFLAFIETIDNPKIKLLRKPNVIKWIVSDTTFLGPISDTITCPDGSQKPRSNVSKNEELKHLEDIWGQTLMREIRTDLKFTKQWTHLFGEMISEELLILKGCTVSRPHPKEQLKPDWETESEIIEVKTQTYFTDGTAGEKILGVPFKYASVRRLFGKPLRIVCIGNAESLCRTRYGNLPGPKMNSEQSTLIDYYRTTLNITFVGATEIMHELMSHVKDGVR